ncbi:putative LRR receptor-like serine/threonine-protein kinase [Citrus sinensis]|uniref:LRR receptor-like serine/threonine-protein kinase n=2 Tax=Citrus sinensis TaxID=2711 RepID=A0ACB8N9W8_CITSI|nr:putative LRR receptor-like serine/threonine-protein kinase [Citrus sinensis]
MASLIPILKLLLASHLLFISLVTFFGYAIAATANKLHAEEVKALKQIGRKLGKKDWNFGVDPCSQKGNWELSSDDKKGFESNVTCDCSSATCHVVRIALKAQNLTGALPPELSKLRYLKQLDLSRNCLTGSFSPQWASLQLVELSVMGNRLSGPFPKVLTNITTLKNLSIEGNLFTGSIPPDIRKLINLQKLILSSNSFTGELPAELTKLTNLNDLRISDNNFSGKIPEFIGKWKKIQKLHIQGSSLEGPIPASISALTSLTDLRISDLKGSESAFPKLDKMNLKTLILTKCLIHGEIPDYIGDMTKLKNMYLTGNKLTGPVPKDKVHPCLRQNFPCSAPADQYHYTLHINCGGAKINTGHTKYEADMEARGASMFYSSGQYWAFSSTGKFMDDDTDLDNYIRTNTSTLSKVSAVDLELYRTARVSPLSLTYYGLCLGNGNYTVRLHFAEIIFKNDSTFNSLGKRIFDIYIQEKLVKKDFNIEDEAGGTGIPIVKNFPAEVTSHTLKIHLYWAGRGTTGIPLRGTYGPLISAISVKSNFKPPVVHSKKNHVMLMAAIVGASVLLVLLILFIMRWKGCLGGKVSADKELRGLDLQTGLYTLRQIKAATNNFDPANKVGEGGFGSVYKGILSDGTVIAVKQLSSKSRQGNREFVNEIGMISAQQHPNLVKLYGCCVEGNQLLLVYEYMKNNCLSRAIFGKDTEYRLKLDWPTRKKICIGIGRGLAYLHEDSRIKIVHRDIKTSNVLLDKDLNAKISDFGLAKLYEEDKTHISTRVAGTIGYMAPEYAMRGYLTSKADVYSFGVVTLEIVSGKSNTNYRPNEDFVYLLDWAYVLQERGNLLELVDPSLGSEYSSEEAMAMLNVALLCTNASPTLRPTMSQVVSMLEGRTVVQDLLADPGFLAVNSKLKAVRSHFWQRQSQTLSISSYDPITDCSNSSIKTGDSILLRESLVQHDGRSMGVPGRQNLLKKANSSSIVSPENSNSSVDVVTWS